MREEKPTTQPNVVILALVTLAMLLLPVRGAPIPIGSTGEAAAPHPEVASPAGGTDYSPSYPRIGIFHFGQAPADWYAKHDLVMANNDSNYSAQIKALNPAVIVLPTHGWTAYGNADNYIVPKEDFDQGAFLVDHSGGEDVFLNCCKRMLDQSSYSRAASSGGYQGRSALQAVPLAAIRYSDLSVSDGVATDWLWAKPYGTDDVDFDRNGVNDYDEHGTDWVYARWREGTAELLANLRAELDVAGPGHVALINFGFQFQQVGVESINGMVREWTTGFGNDFGDGYFWNDEYKFFMATAPKPHVALIDGRADRADPWVKALEDKTDVRDHLQAMRFLLGVTTLGDAYFNFQTFEEATSTQNHHIHAWYDEFDVDLGQAIDLGQPGPLEDAQELKADLWVRFFDHGAVLVNTQGAPQTVTEAELSTLAGYQGPYWRFLGGQDLALNGLQGALNDGSAFDHLTLGGYTYERNGKTKTIGDAVFLLKSPQTIVADIVVDNRGFSTSPGSEPAEFNGTFTQRMGGGREMWSVYAHKKGRSYQGVEYWHTHAQAEGAGEATFRPTIGVAGTYEVLEWHGHLGDSPDEVTEATQVQVTIQHADGSDQLELDQSVNAGLWNSLGTYRFTAGTEGAVRLTHDGAGGSAIADAVKFVWRGDGPSPTFTDVPPSHWAYEEIEALYRNGYVAGCSADPLRYCPEQILNRSESAVFVVRGVLGADFDPPQPTERVFADLPLDHWSADWVTQLWNEGYTAGCGLEPLVYCPDREHTRAEGAVFFLRMMEGVDFEPADPQGLLADVDLASWYARWVEEAYLRGILLPCQVDPDLLACPLEPLDRAMAAYMMVQAKGLDPGSE
jgi:hypothetical protein